MKSKSYDLHMTHIGAVLTGDLIASTDATPKAVDDAMAVLSSAADRVSAWTNTRTLFTRFRGDGWQMFLSDPGLTLRCCLLLIASLRASSIGLATRISVGIGTTGSLGRGSLSDASGEAFVMSGHGLDNMAKTKRLEIAGAWDLNSWQTAIFDIVEWQSGRWSREQAEAALVALEPGNHAQADMAAKLGITRQAMQARLNSAGVPALASSLRAFEMASYHTGILP
jgi:hypothetical protein